MKTIGLLSGGLDSTLAVQLMVDQGLEVIAVKFTSPFCQCDQSGCCHAASVAQRLGIPRAEAGEIIDHYFKQFPGIRRYMDETIASARSCADAVYCLDGDALAGLPAALQHQQCAVLSAFRQAC